MAFFTDSFLNDRRTEFLRSLKKFQYQRNGGTWHDGVINSMSIAGTSVVVFVHIPSFGVADTITGVRVYDQNNNIAGQQSISLTRSSVNTGLLRFTFPLIEQTV